METLNILEVSKCNTLSLMILSILCFISAIILFVSIIKSLCNNGDDYVLYFGFMFMIIVIFLGAFTSNAASERSEKHEYKILIDGNTDIKYIYDNYEVIDTSSEIWIIRDKNKKCNCENCNHKER